MMRITGVFILFCSVVWSYVQVPPTLDLDYEISNAQSSLNHLREAAGLNPLTRESLLDKAAINHAMYMVSNNQATHTEEPSKKNFTGYTPSQRAVYAGYPSRLISENLTTNSDNAQQAVESLFSAIYHRFAFLDPMIDEVGIGIVQTKTKQSVRNAFVFEMGNESLKNLCKEKSFNGYGLYIYNICADKTKRIKKKAFLQARNMTAMFDPNVIIYPFADQKDVPTVFYDEEPDPLPDIDVCGFPISVNFNPYFFKTGKPVVDTFELYDKQGHRMKTRLLNKELDPNAKLTALQFALFPLKRLEYNSDYVVRLRYRYKGETHKLAWSFHTKKPPEKVYKIDKNQTTIHVKNDSAVWLYFVPQDVHDTIKNVRYDKALQVSYIDDNTLRVIIPDKIGVSYHIEASHRHVTISR